MSKKITSFTRFVMILASICFIISCVGNKQLYHFKPPSLPDSMYCDYDTHTDKYELDKNCDAFIRDYVEFLIQR